MRTTVLSLLFIICFFALNGQENSMELTLSINENGIPAHNSAILDVNSTDKGILIPRMSTVARDLVASPATGLLVFDINENTLVFYDGASWTPLLYTELDGDAFNELQDLFFVGTNLSIEDGNTVDLSSLQDGTGTDDQTISISGTELTIEDGNTIDLSSLQDGTGTDDQTLTLTGTVLSIESGNSVLIKPDKIQDADSDTYVDVENSSDADEILFVVKNEETFTIKTNADGTPQMKLESTNLFIGNDAGRDNVENFPDGNWNTFLGSLSGSANTSGSRNTYLGYLTGNDNSTGDNNVAIGTSSGHANEIGSGNTSMGTYSLESMDGGDNNVALGLAAARFKTSGDENVFIGSYAGENNATGNGNVFIGYRTGENSTESYKLIIDNSSTTEPLIEGDFSTNDLQINGILAASDPVGSNTSGQIFLRHQDDDKFSLGYNTSSDYFFIKDEVNDDQVLYIRDSKVGFNRANPTNDFEVNGSASKSSAGDWLANSDARLKKDIREMNAEKTLNAMMNLKGITYEWNDQNHENVRPEGIQYGFTAQNIQAVFPHLVSEDNQGYLQTAYGTYDAMYVESIRALLNKINSLERRIADLEKTK